MNAKVLLGSGLALLLLLSSCRLLEDMEAPMVPEEEDVNYESAIVCAFQPMPQFPGGQERMWQFLRSNLKWPEELRENCISGIVVAKMVIEKNGTISSIEIARGLVPALDAETIRVIKKMPKWIPATLEGEPIRSEFLLPIKWTIE